MLTNPFSVRMVLIHFAIRTNNRYLYPWIVMGTTFIPVIPTYSANVAGTASLSTQWYIGQGVEAFGFAGLASNFFHWSGTANLFDQELGKRFGGYVQAQYYFTNQWFLNAAYAMSRSFGISPGETESAFTCSGREGICHNWRRPAPSYQHEYDLTLWFRPITAIKFGLQYAYIRSNWFQNTQSPAGVKHLIYEQIWRRPPGGVRRVLLLLSSKAVD